jgi:hypothetical protein
MIEMPISALQKSSIKRKEGREKRHAKYRK